jgi:hypothetical protein
MTQQHPITPPPELVQQWREQAPRCRDGGIARKDWLMTRAAQWGADQELEACCDWLSDFAHDHPDWPVDLLIARRPQPETLKSIALKMLYTIEMMDVVIPEITDTLRRALEQLPDHEPSGNSR